MSALDRAHRKTLVYKGLATLLESVPNVVAVTGAEAIGGVLARRKSQRRTTITDHLRTILEYDSRGIDVDPALLERYVRRSFRSYARYWADGATLGGQGAAGVINTMEIAQGYDALREAQRAGNGVLIALPHIGSWEWGGSYLHRVDLTMTAIAERLEPPELFDWFVERRRQVGLEIEGLGPEAVPAVMATLKAGGVVGLLCDRDIVGGGIPATLFGRQTTVPAGPATIAFRSGAPLFVAAVYIGPGRSHTAIVRGPISTQRQTTLRKDVARLTQQIVTELEGLIARTPEQWHVFQPNFADRTAT